MGEIRAIFAPYIILQAMDISNIDVNRGRKLKFFIHLIVICIIFFLPEMLQQYGRPHISGPWMWWPYAKALMFVGIFYLNYYVIIDRTVFGRRRHLWIFMGCNVLLLTAVFFFNYLVQRYWFTHMGPPRRHHELPAMVLMMREWAFYLRDLGMVVLTVALSVALKFMENWSLIQKKHQEMESRQRSAELESLKSQLNPHFLFNTLNTIYSLIDISPREAQDAVHRLSKLMRYMLYENPTEVRLSQEIDFARNYISLMELRIGPGIVKADFDCSNNDAMVPPLLFFTLIENACKHGNTGRADQPIEISLRSDTDGLVVCHTRNHFIPGRNGSSHSSGIGLANLQRRLELLYGNAAILTSSADDDNYVATLTIDTKAK